MKRNRIIVAVLAAVLTLSGCACENSKDKKDEKVVQKKKEKKESKQEAVNLPEESEAKPVVDTTLSDLYRKDITRMPLLLLVFLHGNCSYDSFEVLPLFVLNSR